MNLKQLQASMLFQNMNESDIQQALNELGWHERSYQAGELIFSAGDRTQETGFVEHGSVSIENTDWLGNRSILSLVSTGHFFAETYAALKNEAMLVDVRANENTNILFIRIGQLTYSYGHRRTWEIALLRNLLNISMHKNLILSQKNFHISPKSARARVMAYLQTVSLQTQALEFDIPFNRQQMADYLNLERTALSKELGQMKKDGVIDFRKNHFRLLK